MVIRLLEDSDWTAVWKIIEPVFREGQTYVYPRDISEKDARDAWVGALTATYVTEENGAILGSYYLKPNQPGQGSHICNCGYIVSPSARGRGIATKMCEHSQKEAAARGFRGMQYNLVVSTNRGAVRLWQTLGFEIVGTLPKAFHHPQAGYVDAFVMFKELRK